MKILDVSAKPVPACASFTYRGFEISMSSIMRPGVVEVVIFRDNKFVWTAATVAHAIEWINSKDRDELRDALRFCITEPGARCMRAPSVAGFVRRLSAISNRCADALK